MQLTDYDREDAQLLLRHADRLMSGRERDACEAAAQGSVDGTTAADGDSDLAIFENFRRQFISELAQWRREDRI